MESINIFLPEPLKRFVDEQIAAGRYGGVNEYVLELIRRDERYKAEEHLGALLLEGLESVESPLTGEDWASIRTDALARVGARTK